MMYVSMSVRIFRNGKTKVLKNIKFYLKLFTFVYKKIYELNILVDISQF